MAGFRLLLRARADLLEIGAFTADAGATIKPSDTWSDSSPDSRLSSTGQSVRAPISRDPSYRRALVGRHAVFYRIASDGKVLIVRVLHAAVLPALHFSNEEADT
jgi:plasmid stabilization system protein ParE